MSSGPNYRIPQFVLTCLVFLAWAPAASAVRLPRLSFEEFKLANGLRVVLLEDHLSPLVTVEVWYHAGSKNEDEGRRGFAHLFEHLMFSATRNQRRGQFSHQIVRSGGMTNAYTTEDATVVWETIPSNFLRVALWLEADRMRNLEITQADLRREIEVVKEERRLRFDNVPYGTVVETLYEQAFTVHPYRRVPIGSMEDLRGSRLDEVREFYRTQFVPNNAALVVVGDFKAEQTRGWIEDYFSPIPPGEHLPAKPIPEEPEQTRGRFLRFEKDVALPALVYGYHMPADGSEDSYALKLLSRILSDGESSRLVGRLVVGKRIALEAESVANFTEHPNLFVLYAILHEGVTLAEGKQEFRAELERLRQELLSGEELAGAQNRMLRDLALERRNTKSLADLLGYATVILKDTGSINREAEKFLAVSPEDIRRVAQKYLAAENLTLIEVQPNAEEKEASAPLSNPEEGRTENPSGNRYSP